MKEIHIVRNCKFDQLSKLKKPEKIKTKKFD